MKSLFVCLLFVLASSGIAGLAARADAPGPALDAYGDPLPPGAIARLGTTRLRHACTALAWAPDGKTFASSAGDAVRIWDAASGKEVRQIKMQWNWFTTLVYNPDGKFLIAGGADGGIHILDATTGREVRTLASGPQQITALALRPDDGTVVTLALGANTPRVWDLTTGKIVRQADDAPNKTPFAPQVLSPDGRRYAAWAQPDLLTAWSADGKELFHAPTQFKDVGYIVFSPDAKTLAVSSDAASQIALWDVDSGKELRRLNGVRVFGPALMFSPNGNYLAGKGIDGTVHVWGVASGKDLRQFKLRPGTPVGSSRLAFSPDGKTLAVVHGLAIHLWDVEANKELHEFVGHIQPVEDVHFSADGKRVLTFSRDGGTGQWDAATAKLLHWRTRLDGGYDLPAAAPDGKTIVFAQPGGIGRWNLETDKGAERPLVAGLPSFVIGLTLSADGRTLAGYAQTIYIWDAQNGKEKSKLKKEQDFNPVLTLSADGGLLAIASDNPNAPVRLWDVAASREVRQFDGGIPAPGIPGAVPPRLALGKPILGAAHLAFSPDGKTLVNVGGSELTFWEVATGRDRMRVPRPISAPAGVAFSPDGSVVAEGTQDGSVLLLDAANGWELTELMGQDGAVTALAFAPDGKTLGSGSANGTVLIWDINEWPRRKMPTTELSDEKLSARWNDLLDGDASRAYKAVLALASSPKAAAPYLKERLAGVEGKNDKRTAQLILDLNDDQFDVRESAQKELEKMGDAALPAVRQALGANPPAESRRRLQELLDRHKEAAAVTEEVRSLRALEALERSGAPEALEALRALAKDAPNAEVKREAAASLDRLTRRTAAP
jgi:WD40 repeat protein